MKMLRKKISGTIKGKTKDKSEIVKLLFTTLFEGCSWPKEANS